MRRDRSAPGGWAMVRHLLLVALPGYVLGYIGAPLVVTFDGYLYLESSDSLFADDFSDRYHFMRQPLYPLLLRIARVAIGEDGRSIYLMNASLWAVGLISFGIVVWWTVGRGPAVAATVLGSFSPIAIGYSAAVLQQAAMGCFIGLGALSVAAHLRRSGPGRLWPWLVMSGGVWTVAEYLSSNLGYLMIPATVCHVAWWFANEPTAGSRVRRLGIGLAAGVVAIVGVFGLLRPWKAVAEEHATANERLSVALSWGLLNQGVPDPDDELVEPLGEVYRTTLAERPMTIQGLRNHGLGGTVTGISNYLDQNGTIGGYARLVKRWPSRYSGALVRTAAALAGFGDGSQTDDILQPNYDDPAPRLFPAPVALADQPLPVEAARRASWATTILRWLYPIDQLLMGPATVLLVLTWVAATARKHWALAGALSIPLALLGSYWLFLWSLDRYGHPVHQARIAATVICVGYVLKAAHDRYDAWNERHGAQPDRTEVET